jgi:hypothetical protein
MSNKDGYALTPSSISDKVERSFAQLERNRLTQRVQV